MTYWFVTAAYARPVAVISYEWELTATSSAHAKCMGTAATACGLPAGTWHRLYAVPFPMARGENCPACLDVVRRATA